jgi:hypothetical protein
MRAIVAGQHDPAALATYRDARGKAAEETRREALTGHSRREHGVALRQALELYDSDQARIEACDQEVKSTLESLQHGERSIDTLPAARHKKRQSHEPQCAVSEALFRVRGVDRRPIDGCSAYTALHLVGECGMAMSRWPTKKHFTSWLTLAPGNKISGGKVLHTKTLGDGMEEVSKHYPQRPGTRPRHPVGVGSHINPGGMEIHLLERR